MTLAEDDFYEEVGRRVRSRRLACHFTQERLGDEVDLSRTSITNIEQGNQPVSAWLLGRFAVILGCDVHDLLPTQAAAEVSQQRLPGDLPPKVADVVRRLATVTKAAN